jgi:hypothetical protein
VLEGIASPKDADSQPAAVNPPAPSIAAPAWNDTSKKAPLTELRNASLASADLGLTLFG